MADAQLFLESINKLLVKSHRQLNLVDFKYVMYLQDLFLDFKIKYLCYKLFEPY